jgi:hypothetical protein
MGTLSTCLCIRVVYIAFCSSGSVFYFGGSALGGVLVWMVFLYVVVVLVCDDVEWSGVVTVWFGGVCVL